MKANLRNVQKYRYYSETCRKQLAEEVDSDQCSVKQLEKRNSLQQSPFKP